MKIAVQGNFRKFSTPLEGSEACMYLDKDKAVTTGVGNWIDTLQLALVLPWRHKSDKRTATSAEIEAEWRMVKGMTSLATEGAKEARKVTTLELSDPAIGRLVTQRLLANESEIANHPSFFAWNSFPADAQLAVHSMVWALGFARFKQKFPKFQMAAVRRSFADMMLECELDASNNPGIPRRNTANKILLSNAAAVAVRDLDPEVLYYPSDLKGVAV